MTKKKALMYFIIFILMVTTTYVWQKIYLEDPAKDFAPECRMVINPSCQYYIMTISQKGKFEEAIKIQKVRIKENEKLLNYFKRQKTDKEIALKAAEMTIQDIIVDSIAVSQIEKKEFKNEKDALNTLKHAKRLVEKNKTFSISDAALKELDQQISAIQK